ncbi:MAG: hypothetical protein HYT07_01370 [Candidatus Levybacteria bacterium]|nr:hypothetical protein [Candidatus Levybacteria bacterium]
MNNKYTYLADYDDMTSLAKGDEIEWMHNRIKKVFIKPTKKFIDSKNNTELAFGITTLICCVIEALGHFRTGRRSDKHSEKDFKLFIKEYMPNASRISKPLYKYFRSGLAHAFVIERGGIEGEIKGLYESRKRNKVFYEVNPWKLFDILVQGIGKYFANLNNKNRRKLRKNFRERFEHSYKFWLENKPRKILHV